MSNCHDHFYLLCCIIIYALCPNGSWAYGMFTLQWYQKPVRGLEGGSVEYEKGMTILLWYQDKWKVCMCTGFHIIWKKVLLKQGSYPTLLFLPLSHMTHSLSYGIAEGAHPIKRTRFLLAYRFRCLRRQWPDHPNLTVKLYIWIRKIVCFYSSIMSQYNKC